VFAILVALAACSEPVLLGVDDDPIVDIETDELASIVSYVKSEDVEVDARYLLGRHIDEANAELTTQMGEILSRVDIGLDGVEVLLETGKVRLIDDIIYQIYFELPFVMRRSQALEAVGLPAQVGAWHGNTLDWVVKWSFGMERIRMGRESRGSEHVTWVEVRKFNPRRR
jgi:hypothetical protein